MTIYTKQQEDTNAISTHTLTWSVTSRSVRKCQTSHISTHTLTWSVTEQVSTGAEDYQISTHTLTWSVTPLTTLVKVYDEFQLTRSRGA